MPWVGGVQPVANEVQATGVTIGSEDRRAPKADRRQSEARLGRSPRSNPGPRTDIVPPSSPRNTTRDAKAGMRVLPLGPLAPDPSEKRPPRATGTPANE